MRTATKSISSKMQILFLLLVAALTSVAGFSEGRATAQTAELTLARREALARPLLQHAEGSAAEIDPAGRTFLLYRTAGAWLALDKAHAIRVYRQAYALALNFEPVAMRSAVQEAILNDLLPLSPTDVLELLPSAGSKSQNRVYQAVVNFAIMQSDYATAVHALDQACAAGYFPEHPATHLMANLSDIEVAVTPFASSSALRTHVFSSALGAYQRKDPSETETWTASRLIARFQADLPAEVVLPAIDTVLTQAAKKDELRPLGTAGVGSAEKNISYNHRYDIELFAVAPALERLDAKQATALLAEHPRVAEYLERFPKGLASFDDFYPKSYGLRGPTSEWVPNGLQLYNSEKGAHSAGLSSLDMGLEFTIPMDLKIGLGVTGSGVFYANPGSPESEIYKQNSGCTDDMQRGLAAARTVPLSRKVPTTCGGPMGGQWCSYQDEFPRANLLRALAGACTTAGNSASAHAVLRELLDLVSQREPETQTDDLAMAADLYLRLGDKAAAVAVVKDGFEIAGKMLQREMEAPDLKGVPKAAWPAADTYRRMITLGVNASFTGTQELVGRIPDPALRELEEIMVARALLGVPVRRYMVQSPKGSLVTGEVDISYDQF